MGVSDSPDMANLYGCHFENLTKILERPEIIFYGRYIDDCFALVYASSEEEAIAIVSTVKFDDCVIEWQASDIFQIFLDMRVFIDDKNKLQHVPYRKDNNHLERLPWISHHPIDVKRGTFLGELSRLSVLCSKKSFYEDAVHSLIGLYIRRGYPSDMVYRWAKDNIQERWSKRFSDRREQSAVLVLKSSYNTAWNYLNARELGNTIFNYWRTWLDRHDRGINPSEDFQAVSASPFADWPANLKTQGDIPDVRTLDILERKVIVSKNRNTNLLDLTGLWKNTVLTQIDQELPMIGDI